MDVYYQDDAVTLHHGDSLTVLPTLPDASVDAIVCDPPYELGFMGKAWDASGIAYNVDLWRQCWRVLKPGGHLLAFGGTRTYHRMTVAIEDAGFEIRDSLHWIYGSGFPKGQDIAKSIDKRRDDRQQVLQVTAWLAAARDAAGWTNRQIDALWGYSGMAGLWTTQGKAAIVPQPEQWDRLRNELGFDDTQIRPVVADLNGRKGTTGEAWSLREVIGTRNAPTRKSDHLFGDYSGDDRVTAPSSDAARQWQGWNTALKPAHEPIVLARKSTGYESTVANVLLHGTGGLNIDGCRTAAGQDYRDKCASVVGLDSNRNGDAYGEWTGTREDSAHVAGRWPTNVLLTHPPLLDDHGQPDGDACSDGCVPGCPIADMDRQSGITGSNARASKGRGMGYHGADGERGAWTGGDTGGASRFFPVFRYEAKAPASERPRLADGAAHPTVKPLTLMQWLVRLVTPPGGIVLDPFAGSGTTLEAARLENFSAIGIEQHEPHAQLVVQRLAKPYMTGLFGEAS
ncbi:DNA methyltransferase [Streptomyces ortus]|uniref:Site-specific DNA-methyltransferase n=1 Tax=Streptomyces ortus TaxID=2867268 RepID=A0ABT3UX04_9ACTN|nr:DNA methyltransferase [Streptomyces ortus]MCX4232094.1 site-specific DNA-methyltransferase [Streptomyces ortus]